MSYGFCTADAPRSLYVTSPTWQHDVQDKNRSIMYNVKLRTDQKARKAAGKRERTSPNRPPTT
jgi:hypothetical protein